MSASLSFSDRVALMSEKISGETGGEWRFEAVADGEHIALIYKNTRLLFIYAVGKTPAVIFELVHAIMKACILYQHCDYRDE